MRALPGDLLERMSRGGRDLCILVLRLGALGDVLRTLPPVRLVRAALPHAKILWLVDDRWARVLGGHPDLDAVLTWPRSALEGKRLVPSLVRALRALRDEKPQLTLDFHGNLRSGLLAALSGAAVRLGHGGHQQKEGNRLFTTHRVPAGPRRTPRMERNLDLVRALGLPDQPLPTAGLALGAGREEARRIVASLGSVGRPYAVVGPGASRKQAYKKPPAALLAAAAARLEARGIAALVTYGPGEESDADAVCRHAPARKAPPTDLHVLACLLEGARLFVGGDSGPLHLACAVGCPVLGLYGPTDPVVNAPWGTRHVALHPPGRTYTGIKKLDRLSGFEGLAGEAVSSAVDGLLALPLSPAAGARAER